jgi:cysteine desulfurase
MIYLDYNATTPVHPEVRAAIVAALENTFGNPSSSHAAGQAAKAIVDEARVVLASMLNANSSTEIVFTGGATEANNLALLGATAHIEGERRHIIVSAIEHPSVIAPARELAQRGWTVSFAPVATDGVLDLEALRAMLAQTPAALISVMHANNELGTIQPIAEVGKLARQFGALFHVDAAQSFGKIAVDVQLANVDLLTIAGHKMYAPKGIGALFVREGVGLRARVFGADQEAGRRPGTENVAYIAGLSAAAGLMRRSIDAWRDTAARRDRLQQGLLESIPGLCVSGSQEQRLPNTLHISLPTGSAREFLATLKDDFALSPGAACHSGVGHEPSGVMLAIGATAQQSVGAIRISLGLETSDEEVAATLHHLPAAYSRYLAAREH